ncbi:hypothetical protein OK074_2964 [Actinobacteria bacterium OK074]|nr:hypothetical protein OK074_2964 [Actinobacteria bacterium OK074]
MADGEGDGTVVIDYDLMTDLARRIWTMRDQLDVTFKQQARGFSAGDIGPRPETAEAMNDFYTAAKGAFERGWQAMTDLGNTFDEVSKAFFDQDGSIAAGAAQQIASQQDYAVQQQNEEQAQEHQRAEDEFLDEYMQATGRTEPLTDAEKQMLLSGRRFQTEHPTPTPLDPVAGYTDVAPDGTKTELVYRRDAEGNVVETTTTVTNPNGLTYSETTQTLSADGDSVTTIHSSDGTTYKVYVDANPPGYAEGYQMRYVTDANGDTLQIWGKEPGGDWELRMDKDTYLNSPAGQDDPQQSLDAPPAYETVQNPLVTSNGAPTGGGYTQQGPTATPADGITRTEYAAPDGSVLKVVTIEASGVRLVADANNVVQEVWNNLPGTTTGWFLKDSITLHDATGTEPPLGVLDPNTLR